MTAVHGSGIRIIDGVPYFGAPRVHHMLDEAVLRALNVAVTASRKGFEAGYLAGMPDTPVGPLQ